MRSTSRFLYELGEIASKFDWYYEMKTFKGGTVVVKEIRGVMKGGDITKEYTPLTAVVESLTSRYYEMDRFDLAANEVNMPPECASLILDACDDWPDRLHGYCPKSYEKKLREDVLKLCFGQ